MVNVTEFPTLKLIVRTMSSAGFVKTEFKYVAVMVSVVPDTDQCVVGVRVAGASDVIDVTAVASLKLIVNADDNVSSDRS